MAILAQCPTCRRKQSVRNRTCKGCAEDLARAKRSQRVLYFARVELGNGKQHTKKVGYSLEEAKAAEGKFKSKKVEGRIFDILPEVKVTFSELAQWYLGNKDEEKGPVRSPHPKIKGLASKQRIKQLVANFNENFGDHLVASVKTIHLEDHQEKRKAKGASLRTIDYELSVVQTMLERARKAGKVSAEIVLVFKDVDRLLIKGSNARSRTLTLDEYLRLTTGKYEDKEGKAKDISPPHLRAILTVAYHTGMRFGELRGLQWSHIDKSAQMIRLPAELTKEKKPKSIPVNQYVQEVFKGLVRAIHHDHVFTYNGEPIKHPTGIKRSFKKACKEAEIPCGQKVAGGIIPHDFRRTFKTNMVRAGVNKPYRDKILGHSPQDMDAHYIKLTDEDLRSAMDQFTDWYEEQEKVYQNDAANQLAQS